MEKVETWSEAFNTIELHVTELIGKQGKFDSLVELQIAAGGAKLFFEESREITETVRLLCTMADELKRETFALFADYLDKTDDPEWFALYWCDWANKQVGPPAPNYHKRPDLLGQADFEADFAAAVAADGDHYYS